MGTEHSLGWGSKNLKLSGAQKVFSKTRVQCVGDPLNFTGVRDEKEKKF